MSDHFPDATKKVSDTPRTDSMRGFHDLDTAVDAEFSEQLERELNAANAHIKQLEQLGDVLAKIADENPHHINDVTRWLKAKEAKP